MANRKISDLTALTTPASGDYLPIVDISEASAANKNKRITIEELLRGAPDGTAGAPGIGFESDPNTGIYSPGADALGLVTAGSERARIDSSGRLLVGTSSTSVGSSAIFQGSSGGAFAVHRLCSTSATPADGADLGYLVFGDLAHSDGAWINAQRDGGTWSGSSKPTRLVFSVTADGAASPTEALRISSNRAITVSDGGHIVLGTGTGTKIGTSTSQKIGFFDETPIVQPTTGIAEAAFVENSGGTAVNVDSTFGGYTIQQVVQALQNLGLLA